MDGEKIAISGISGRFPNCDNVEEFKNALLENIDLLTHNHSRWCHESFEVPSSMGVLDNLDKFDATFFGMNPKQDDFDDPKRRILTEIVYESIIDAGINPEELRGSNTGVFCVNYVIDNPTIVSTLLPNAISFSFDFKGPSVAIDTSCSSAFYALHQAILAIENGDCECAVVASAQLQMDPKSTVYFSDKDVLSFNGVCKVFDEGRDGFVKADAAIAIFLQKSNISKRIYATVEGIGVNVDGYKEDGLFHPSTEGQLKMIQNTFKKFNLNPDDVTYFETHGTGTVVGDVEECKSIYEFFKRTKENPLLIGSVKSNVGHAEHTSGLVSLIKAIIIFHEGIIPANLHLEKPSPEIFGIQNGSLKVVTSNTDFSNGLIAINSFGLGGANGHLILKPFIKPKSTKDASNQQQLMLVSGRTEEGVEALIEKIFEHEDNAPFLRLIREIFRIPTPQHYIRGYAITGPKPSEEIRNLTSKNRPLWFLYSGMGSQTAEMAKDLMEIEIFKNSFKKCAEAVALFGIDLKNIVFTKDESMFDNVINNFTGITAMSICLTDILRSFGIIPDKIIGHSLGEVACAYADGAITIEQAMLVSYARGYASLKAKLTPGLMAACALSKEECETLLPSDIFVACVNSDHNVTISGPEKSIKNFVRHLQNEGTFARIINTGNIAYHSKYIKEAGPIFLDFISKVALEPKLRSDKWLSSSFRESDWSKKACQYCSTEYFWNNFTGQVHFGQLLKHIPGDAVVVEISPKALFQRILSDNVSKEVTAIKLFNLDADNKWTCLLNTIGKIYLSGVDPKPSEPKITENYFPCDANIPMLSPLVKWNHETSWPVQYYSGASSFYDLVTINVSKEKYKYLKGHVADDKNYFPGTGYIELIWRTYGKFLGKPFYKLPIVIEDLKFERGVIITPANDTITFKIFFMMFSGNFEITEGDSLVATGRIFTPEEIDREFISHVYKSRAAKIECELNCDEFYNINRIRGYDYNGLFQGVHSYKNNGEEIILDWRNNWTAFLDTMLQGAQFKNASDEFFLPIGIKKITVDPNRHLNLLENGKFHLDFDHCMKAFKAGGVEIRELSVFPKKRHLDSVKPTMNSHYFIPYKSSANFGFDDLTFCFYVCIQIVKDNTEEEAKHVYAEVLEDDFDSNSNYLDLIKLVSETSILRYPLELKSIAAKQLEKTKTPHDVLLLKNLFSRPDFLQYFDHAKFIFTECDSAPEALLNSNGIAVVFEHAGAENKYFLLKRTKETASSEISSVVKISNDDFSWIKDLKAAIMKSTSEESRIFVTTDEAKSGVVGFFNCLRREDHNNLRVFVKGGDTFNFASQIYEEQIRKDLAVNVYKNQRWGCYLYLPMRSERAQTSQATLEQLNSGDPSSFDWVENGLKHWEMEKLVKVCFSALNYRDLLVASGKLRAKDVGCEFSGLDRNGKRVMGIVRCGGLSTYVKCEECLMWEVPEKWSLAQAASVPIAYTTSYYGMVIRGGLQRGETVLIHSGDQDIGLAAITLALNMNCEIFTTVDCDANRIYLKEKFPRLVEKNIINSKFVNFEEYVMHQTNGEGVDLILNSFTNEEINSTLRCIKKGGRFIVIGTHNRRIFLKHCSIIAVDLFEEMHVTGFRKIIQDALQKDMFEPLDFKIYRHEETALAFKVLEESNCREKVLINIRSEDNFSQKTQVSAIPKTIIDPKKSYIIIGGLGGFGFEIGKWLVDKGCRILILNSRRPVSSNLHIYYMNLMKDRGVIVKTTTDDCSTEDGTKNLIKLANGLGAVGGIFNAALVLSDSLFENQTEESFKKVSRPKYEATKHLDRVSREMCPLLEHFVVFTSVANGMGNIALSNYAFTNSAMERICQNRRAKNLPALAIQYGPIKDVGYVQKLKDKRQNLTTDVMELKEQSLSSCLNVIDECLQNPSEIVVSCFMYKEKHSEADVKFSVTDRVSKIFGIDLKTAKDKNMKLVQLGLDSLGAFEIKSLLSVEYDLDINVNDIKSLTIRALEEIGA